MSLPVLQFEGITAARWAAICSAIQSRLGITVQGPSGTDSGEGPLGEYTVTWSWDENAGTLSVQCTKKPLLVPSGTVQAAITGLVDQTASEYHPTDVDLSAGTPGVKTVKLGRRAVRRDARTLMTAKYMKAGLSVSAPAVVDWTGGVTSWGMMLNDTLGDCTIAGVAHAVQVLTKNAGPAMVTVPDATVESYYEKWDGYVPGNPGTDEGGVELDVLNDWRQQGFAGHALGGYADPNVADLDEVHEVIELFGGAYIGMNVPNFLFADGAPDPAKVWDVVANDGGIAGGHCVYVAGSDRTKGTLKLISWGHVYTMTDAFWTKYVDEAHALLSPDWIGAKNVAASGFDLEQLQSDLAAIE